MSAPLTVVVIGVGQMGRLHLQAYHENPGYKVIGILDQQPPVLPTELAQYQDCILPDLDTALRLKPDVVSINTHVDSHAEYSIAALESGSHVFVEKPLAASVTDAERIVATAERVGRKLLVGYILRHHPTWTEFISQARNLGPPFVLRMNLNQRSSGDGWAIHQRILQSASPVVDCGVHYIDVMLQITGSRVTQVRGMGASLLANNTDQPASTTNPNYSHLQILFDDGSVGWFEAGWGPMMSRTAYFIQDAVSPNGAVSIVLDVEKPEAYLDTFMQPSKVEVYPLQGPTRRLDPNHHLDLGILCAREQDYLLDSIQNDRNLSEHMSAAVESLKIVLAADQSMRENRPIDLDMKPPDLSYKSTYY